MCNDFLLKPECQPNFQCIRKSEKEIIDGSKEIKCIEVFNIFSKFSQLYNIILPFEKMKIVIMSLLIREHFSNWITFLILITERNKHFYLFKIFYNFGVNISTTNKVIFKTFEMFILSYYINKCNDHNFGIEIYNATKKICIYFMHYFY